MTWTLQVTHGRIKKTTITGHGETASESPFIPPHPGGKRAALQCNLSQRRRQGSTSTSRTRSAPRNAPKRRTDEFAKLVFSILHILFWPIAQLGLVKPKCSTLRTPPMDFPIDFEARSSKELQVDVWVHRHKQMAVRPLGLQNTGRISRFQPLA